KFDHRQSTLVSPILAYYKCSFWTHGPAFIEAYLKNATRRKVHDYGPRKSTSRTWRVRGKVADRVLVRVAGGTMRQFLFSFVLCAALLAGSSHKDITGVWQLDTANSPTISGRSIVSGTLTVVYHQNMIDTSEKFNFGDGDRNIQRNWKVDHRYHPVLGDGGG